MNDNNNTTKQSAADRYKENEEVLHWAYAMAKKEPLYVQRIMNEIRKERRERRQAKR